MKYTDISKFRKLTATIDYKPICEEYAEKSTDTLKSISPASGRPNRATPYKDGWVWNEKYFKQGLRTTVWNRTNWQLTHLLENGHFVTNLNSLTWVQPRKHIKPTFDKFAPKFVKAMRKVDIDVEIN